MHLNASVLYIFIMSIHFISLKYTFNGKHYTPFSLSSTIHFILSSPYLFFKYIFSSFQLNRQYYKRVLPRFCSWVLRPLWDQLSPCYCNSKLKHRFQEGPDLEAKKWHLRSKPHSQKNRCSVGLERKGNFKRLKFCFRRISSDKQQHYF